MFTVVNKYSSYSLSIGKAMHKSNFLVLELTNEDIFYLSIMKCRLCQNYTITCNHYFEDIYVNIHRNLINYNKYLLNTHCI